MSNTHTNTHARTLKLQLKLQYSQQQISHREGGRGKLETFSYYYSYQLSNYL